MIAETAGNGPTGATGTVREYIYLPETEIAPAVDGRTRVDRPLAVVNAVNTALPATYYVHVDHLNRPVMMTDSTKVQVWAAVWQAWGGSYSITGPQANDMRFPGQWFQIESGLHYNWHRHYDPSIGRYIQPDPLGFVDGPSVYGYVMGAPQSLVDPDGHFISRICKWWPALCDFQFDGPGAGLSHGNGRVFGVRYGKKHTICRIDYAPYPGTNNQSRLHGHFFPFPDKHVCLDPRGCIK